MIFMFFHSWPTIFIVQSQSLSVLASGQPRPSISVMDWMPCPIHSIATCSHGMDDVSIVYNDKSRRRQWRYSKHLSFQQIFFGTRPTMASPAPPSASAWASVNLKESVVARRLAGKIDTSGAKETTTTAHNTLLVYKQATICRVVRAHSGAARS